MNPKIIGVIGTNLQVSEQFNVIDLIDVQRVGEDVLTVSMPPKKSPPVTAPKS